MIDSTNTVTNYRRHLTHDICATVRSLSPERKQKLLDEIQLHKATSNFTNCNYDHQTCEYIESLLNGKRPRNRLSNES